MVELLVVMGLIAALISMLLPALRRSRLAAEQVACASNLRQMGNAIQMYVGDHEGRLPFVVEPFWRTNGTLDWDADPLAPSNPHSFIQVLSKYLADRKVFLCPTTDTAYPRDNPAINYRVSAANNFDGQIRFEEQLFNGDGTPQYNYSLKYLNGRKHRLLFVDGHTYPFQLKRGLGPFYLARDFVGQDSAGKPRPPHNRQFNQLRLDLSVSLEKDPEFGFTYP